MIWVSRPKACPKSENSYANSWMSNCNQVIWSRSFAPAATWEHCSSSLTTSACFTAPLRKRGGIFAAALDLRFFNHCDQRRVPRGVAIFNYQDNKHWAPLGRMEATSHADGG